MRGARARGGGRAAENADILENIHTYRRIRLREGLAPSVRYKEHETSTGGASEERNKPITTAAAPR